MLFRRGNNKNKKKCYSEVGTTKTKSVVPKWEQQKPKVLFRSGNNKNKKCCSELGTTKTKSFVLKWEQQKQKNAENQNQQSYLQFLQK